MVKCLVCGKDCNKSKEWKENKTLWRRKICSWKCLKKYREHETIYKKYWIENKSLDEIKELLKNKNLSKKGNLKKENIKGSIHEFR